jgi:hypothetical protein
MFVGTFENSGLISAHALDVYDATIDDTSGGVLSGSHLSLASTTIVGGGLAIGSGDTMDVEDVSDLATSLSNNGTIFLEGTQLTLQGTVANDGQIEANGYDHNSLIIASAGVVLSGGGTVSLGPEGGDAVTGQAPTATLTNVDNTVSGAGLIGGAQLAVVNQAQGVIDATANNALTIDATVGVSNAGLIESTGTGGLVLRNGTLSNAGQVAMSGSGGLSLVNATLDDTAGGTLALGNSTVLTNSAIFGGSLVLAQGATITAVGADTISTALTNNGVVDVQAGAALTLHGAVANAGQMSLLGTSAASGLIVGVDGAVLSGGGTVSLGARGSNALTGQAPTATLTNVDNTISGAGLIGGAQLAVVNEAQGLIVANAAVALTIDATADVSNAGLIESNGAGGLVLRNGTLSNSGQIAVAGTGGLSLIDATLDDTAGGRLSFYKSISLTDSAILGGALTVARDYVLSAAGDDTLSMALTNAGAINILAGASLTLQGAIDNAARINMFGSGVSTSLIVGAAGATLSGHGQVLMGNVTGRSIVGASTSALLTNIDNLIIGAGALGGGTMALSNGAKGKIIGNAANALTIDTGANTIANAGVIAASGAGQVVVQSALNNTGRIESYGGTMTVNGSVTGGGLAVIADGTLDFTAGFNENVTFLRPSGVLELAQSQTYAGSVYRFSLTGATTLDLRDIGFAGAGEATFLGNKYSGVLTVTDGTNTAKIRLVGDYLGATFVAADDGQGGTAVIAHAAGAPAAFLSAAAAMGGGGDAAATGHASTAFATTAPTLARPITGW